jgi:hypothetical protein
MINVPRLIPVACLFLIPALALAQPPAATPKPNKFKDPLKVGAAMPFLVVQFQTGPTKGGACPSVMIANAHARGLVIWSRTADPAALQLTKDADANLIDDDKVQGYLVVFDEKADELQPKLAKLELKHVSAGWARRSSADFFPHAGLDANIACVVSVVDDDTVKALWSFKPNELTAEKRATILKEAAGLLRANKAKE